MVSVPPPSARIGTRSASSRRRAAAVLAAAAVLTAPAALAFPAAADGSASGGSLADQATALVARMQQEDLLSDQLAEQVDTARIEVAQIATRLQAAQASVAATNVNLNQATAILQEQAVAAYMQGGRPLTYVAHDTADDPTLIEGYASALTGIQQSSISRYQAERKQLTAQTTALTNARAAATASLEQLQAAQHDAQAAAAQTEATLAQVQGTSTLATLVTHDQAVDAAQTAQQVESRFGVTGTNTPVHAATASDPGSSAAAPGTAAVAPATTPSTAAPSTATPATPITTPVSARAPFGNTVPTLAPATAAPTTAAPTTAAPTTAAPTTAAPTTAATSSTTHSTFGQPNPTTSTTVAAPSSGVIGGASTAISVAEAQLGKPYAWGGAGPSSYDCSGLVMVAFEAVGVSFPHSAQDQYDMTERVPIADLEPGDLVFYGTPSDVYHVGIYIGGGEMIDAPHTGADVRIESIYWTDLLSGGRVT